MDAITWKSKDEAHQLAAWVEDGLFGPEWHATLDGHDQGSALSPNRNIPPAARAAGIVASIGRVALTKERYDALQAEVKRLAAEWAATPAGLRSQRDSLEMGVRGALEDARLAREQAFEDDCAHGLPGYDTSAVLAARSALAEFDAAHPEIVKELKADEAAAVERNKWM